MNNLLKTILILFASFNFLNVLGQGVVCRAENIADTKWEYNRGIRTIGKETTTDLSQMKVYVSYKVYGGKTYIYCHSNYITTGYKHPTKLLYDVEEIGTDLSSYIQNIAFDRYPSLSDEINLTNALEKIQVYLDYRLFENKNLAYLNIDNFLNIKIVKGITEVPTPPKNELIKIQNRIQLRIEENHILKGQFDEVKSIISRENINRLNIIGEIQIKPESLDELVEVPNELYKRFQTKHKLQETGNFDFPTEKKLIEQEESIFNAFEILGQNPNKHKELRLIIEDFQTIQSLPKTGIYDNKTFSNLVNLRINLKNKLESIIYGVQNKSLSSQIDIYKDIKKFNDRKSVADKEFWNALKSDKNYYISIDGEYKPFQNSNISIKNTEGIEIENLKTIRYEQESNVHLILNKDLPLSIQSLNKKLDWDYDIDELVVFPMTKNSDTRNLLKQQFGKNWIKSNLKSEKEIAKKLKRSKRKTVLVVGHIEDGFYVEGNFKISIEQLNKYAKEYNLNIFHLGCSSAMDGVGTAASINTHKTVDALISSIKENSNFKDFFLSFSTKGIGPNNLPVDLLVDANTFSNKGYAQFKVYQKGGIAGLATVGGGILLYYLLSDNETDNKE